MNSEERTSGIGEGHVLRFRHRRSTELESNAPADDDLAKYHRDETADDYRHRMLVNGAALLFVIVLIGIGIWLADTMAHMRRNQDCVLSGRRGCTPVEYSHDRW
jgi:hypothetical protein